MLVRLAAFGVSFVLVLWGILGFADQRAQQQVLSSLREAAPPAAYRIERDEWGVPTIYGETDGAVAFGLAYAHAEDDFRTLQERMAPIRSEAGALLGADGAKIDYVGHLLGISLTASEGMKTLSPASRAMAKGYADGLNAYAADHPGEIISHRLFPVTEHDILAGFALIAPFFYGVDDTIGDLLAGTETGPEKAAEARGSNAFAIAPSKMADGSTVLISNSHQPWEGSLAWYEARLASGEGWSMAGPLFPGVPFILMGYNEHLAWTNTVNVPDLVDVYELKLDNSGKRYELDGEWRDLIREPVWLRVKFGPFVVPVRRMVERSVHGPVIRNDDGAFAFRYAGMGSVRNFEQYRLLNRATSLDEWMAAMRLQGIASTNFLYADKEGNIAYLYYAAFPDRIGLPSWGDVLPGDDSRYIWSGYRDFADMPIYLNPESGYLVNANNTPFLATATKDNLRPEDFAGFPGIEAIRTNRILRALALLEEHEGPLTREDLHRIKYDRRYDPDSPLGQLFVDVVSDASIDDVDAEAATLLRQWDYELDGRGKADSLAALVIYNLYLGMRGWHEMPDADQALGEAADHLREHFGRLDPPLEELSRLRRGDADLPITGGPDALRALYWGFDEDGRMYGLNGDGYIGYYRWGPDGTFSAETVYPFGAAMGRPASPHYNDQSALFADELYKPAPVPDWREATPEAFAAREADKEARASAP
ncbi:MAG: penicillin acylase family protein [Parvularcula sp.]|jgi:acyl-homoserine-lactone acylase|nr:penicillin acylase family protein [Parvularcula sp.]